MGLVKKIIALSLLGGSIAFAVLIVQEKSTPIVLDNSTSNKSENLPAASSPAIDRGENSTSKIAEGVAEKLGPLKDINDLREPEKLINEVFQNQFAAFDPKTLTPEVKLEDLKISNASDFLSRDNYLKNIRAIAEGEISKLKTNFNNLNVDDFAAIAGAYGKIVENLYKLVVSKDLASYHQEMIKSFGFQKNVFAALADYKNDPFKAMAALNLWKEGIKHAQ